METRHATPEQLFSRMKSTPQPRKTLPRTPAEESQFRRNLAEGSRESLRETSQNATSAAPANLVPPHASRRESQQTWQSPPSSQRSLEIQGRLAQ